MTSKKYTIDEIFITPRTLFNDNPALSEYRHRFRAFIKTEKLQQNLGKYEQDGQVDKGVFQRAMEQGFYLPGIDSKYGGSGLCDFRYNAIISEELEYHDLGSVFLPLGNDIVLPYFTHITTRPKDQLPPSHFSADEQKSLWLPYIVKNKSIISVCMSEAGAGSDLQAVTTTAKWDPATHKYILNGRKLWISSGTIADLHVVVAITGDVTKNPVHKCLTLFVVKATDPGFKVTKTLDKIGRHAQDTSSLWFKDVSLGPERVLGEKDQGFKVLMQNLSQERLGVAISATAGTTSVLRHTLNYINYRRLFGRTVGDFQYVQLKIAEMLAKCSLLQISIDHAISLHIRSECNHILSSALKQQATELYSDVAGQCLQFFGGVGYLKASPIANHFVDSKVTTIYAGSNQVMLEIIARKFGLQRAPPPVKEEETRKGMGEARL